jgi:alpha-tubulin suppressor-like RCC1 family protein
MHNLAQVLIFWQIQASSISISDVEHVLISVEPVDVPVDSARPLALATASVAQIACGAEHTLVLTTNGVVAACGAGMFGRLGLEPRSESDARAARVLRALLPRVLLAAVEEADAIDAAYEAVHSNSSVSAVECVLDEGDVVTRIAASAHNSACVTRSGAVFVWGSGDCGQVGSGIMEPSFLPHRVRGALDGVHIMQVVLGERHCLALAQDGRVFSWGSNEFGQLGRTVEESTDQMSSLPHEVSLLAPSHLSADDRVVELGCAASTSFARTQHGRLLAWGAHDTQQLGGSAVEGMDARTPIVVATDAAAMFIGRLNCMYRRSDGQLLGWGFHLGANPRELHGMPASESKQTLAIGGDLIVICV